MFPKQPALALNQLLRAKTNCNDSLGRANLRLSLERIPKHLMISLKPYVDLINNSQSPKLGNPYKVFSINKFLTFKFSNTLELLERTSFLAKASNFFVENLRSLIFSKERTIVMLPLPIFYLWL